MAQDLIYESASYNPGCGDRVSLTFRLIPGTFLNIRLFDVFSSLWLGLLAKINLNGSDVSSDNSQNQSLNIK